MRYYIIQVDDDDMNAKVMHINDFLITDYDNDQVAIRAIIDNRHIYNATKGYPIEEKDIMSLYEDVRQRMLY